jgi:hypothetical protein
MFDTYTAAVHELRRRQAEFDANEAFIAMTASVSVGHIRDVVRLLSYLVSIGTLEALPARTRHGPACWRYVG